MKGIGFSEEGEWEENIGRLEKDLNTALLNILNLTVNNKLT